MKSVTIEGRKGMFSKFVDSDYEIRMRIGSRIVVLPCFQNHSIRCHV